MSDSETIIQLNEEIQGLRLALIKIQRHTHQSSIWGGMATKFHQMAPFRVKKVDELCKTALLLSVVDDSQEEEEE